MNWIKLEIIFHRSQNALMAVSSRDLLSFHHGAQNIIDSFWCVISSDSAKVMITSVRCFICLSEPKSYRRNGARW